MTRQHKEILKELKKGGIVTIYSIPSHLSHKLTTRISEMRKMGLPIKKAMQPATRTKTKCMGFWLDNL